MELENQVFQLSQLLEKVALAKRVRELMPVQKHNNPEFNGYYSVKRFEKDLIPYYRIELDYRFFSFHGLHAFKLFAEAFAGFYNALAAQPLDFQPHSYQYEDDWMEAEGVIGGLDTNKHYIYLECRKSNAEARYILDEFASILEHS